MGQHKAVGRDYANIGLSVNKTLRREVFGVDDGVIDICEDFEIGGAARIIAIRRQSVGNIAFALLFFFEGFDHALGAREFANLVIGQQAGRHEARGILLVILPGFFQYLWHRFFRPFHSAPVFCGV